MKKYTLAVVLLFTSPALAQIMDVQSNAKWNCTGSGASVSCPVILGATHLNNLLAVWTFWESTSPYSASVKDSNTGNNFVSAVGPTVQMAAGIPTSGQIFYARNLQPSSPNDTVTITFAGPSTGSPMISRAGVVAVEYSGLDLGNPLDDVSAGYSNSSSPGSMFDSGWAPLSLVPPTTGSNQNVVIFGAAVSDAMGTPTAGTNFSLVQSDGTFIGLCGLTEEHIFVASASNFQHANAGCASGNWWLAHLYVLCKGGNDKVGCHSFSSAPASKLARWPTIPSATTGRMTFISLLAVVIIGRPGWRAGSVAISSSQCSNRSASVIAS